MSSRLKLDKKNKAFSLIEVMIALGVIGIVSASLASFYSRAHKAERRLRIISMQKILARTLENKLQDPTSLFLSIVHDNNNQNLFDCLVGHDDLTREKCRNFLTSPLASNSWEDLIKEEEPDLCNRVNVNCFSLSYASSFDIINNLSSLAQAETSLDEITPKASGQNIFFNTRGDSCQDGDGPPCLFEAFTFFYFTCPSSTDYDQQTEDGKRLPHLEPRYKDCRTGIKNLHLAYILRVRGFEDQRMDRSFNIQPDLPAYPQRAQFFTISPQRILGPFLNSSCNPGAVIVGFDSEGKANCECKPPFKPSNNFSQNRKGPLCDKADVDAFHCKTEDGKPYFRGFKTIGLGKGRDQTQIRCEKPQDAFECYESSITLTLKDYIQDKEKHPAALMCDPGYKLSGINISDCKLYCLLQIGDVGEDIDMEEAGLGKDLKSDFCLSYDLHYEKDSRRVERDLRSEQISSNVDGLRLSAYVSPGGSSPSNSSWDACSPYGIKKCFAEKILEGRDGSGLMTKIMSEGQKFLLDKRQILVDAYDNFLGKSSLDQGKARALIECLKPCSGAFKEQSPAKVPGWSLLSNQAYKVHYPITYFNGDGDLAMPEESQYWKKEGLECEKTRIVCCRSSWKE